MGKLATKFGSEKQDWETPDSIFEPLNREFNFDCDVCATHSNAKCKEYFTESDDALIQQWHGRCWMNPPFNQLGKWVKKAFEESRNGATVVCLLPSRTNTNWWHEYVINEEVRFIKGRPAFNGAKHGLPQPLAIVVFKPKQT